MEDENIVIYYRSYIKAAQHTRAGDMILFEWDKGYYISRPYEKLKEWGWRK